MRSFVLLARALRARRPPGRRAAAAAAPAAWAALARLAPPGAPPPASGARAFSARGAEPGVRVGTPARAGLPIAALGADAGATVAAAAGKREAERREEATGAAPSADPSGLAFASSPSSSAPPPPPPPPPPPLPSLSPSVAGPYEDLATPEARSEELERCARKIHELGGGSQRTVRAALLRASGAASARQFPWIWERDLCGIVTVLSELTLGDFGRSMRSLTLLQSRNVEAEACRARAEAFAERLDLEPKEVARLVSLVPQVVYQDHSQTLGPSLDLLLGLGFPPRRAASMLMRFPRLVLYRPQRLSESLEALAERGVTLEQRMTMLERFPALVSGRPGRSFDAVVGWLEGEIGLSRADAANVVVRTPFILGCSVESNLRPSAKALADGLELSPKELATILRAVPTALQLRPDTLTRRFSALRRLGADPRDIRRLIVTCPSLLRCQLDMPKYKTKLNFAKRVLGADVPKLLSAFPPILAYSLKRLVTRGAFLKHKGALGGSRGLAVSMWLPKAQESWLNSIKSSKEEFETFCEEWVKDPNNARWLDESGDIGDKAVGDDDDDEEEEEEQGRKQGARARAADGADAAAQTRADADPLGARVDPSAADFSPESPMPPQRPRRTRQPKGAKAKAKSGDETEENERPSEADKAAALAAKGA